MLPVAHTAESDEALETLPLAQLQARALRPTGLSRLLALSPWIGWGGAGLGLLVAEGALVSAEGFGLWQLGAALGLVVPAVLLGWSASLILRAYLLQADSEKRGAAREALARRLGQAGIEQDVTRAEARANEPDAPATTLLFRGQGLPGGEVYWLCLELRHGADGPAATLESRVGPRLNLAGEALRADEVVQRRRTFAGEQLGALERALERVTQEGLGSVKSCHIDGFPCEIALVQRGSAGALRGGCNLYGLDPRRGATPVVGLIRALLDLHGGEPGAWQAIASHAMARQGLHAPEP